MEEDINEDIYEDTYREDLLDADEIDDAEEGFMRGYDEAGEV